jgi:hypothetical protein
MKGTPALSSIWTSRSSRPRNSVILCGMRRHSSRECGAPHATKDDAASLHVRQLRVTPAFAVDRNAASRLAHLDGEADPLRCGQPARRRELNLSGRFVGVRGHDVQTLVGPQWRAKAHAPGQERDTETTEPRRSRVKRAERDGLRSRRSEVRILCGAPSTLKPKGWGFVRVRGIAFCRVHVPSGRCTARETERGTSRSFSHGEREELRPTDPNGPPLGWA